MKSSFEKRRKLLSCIVLSGVLPIILTAGQGSIASAAASPQITLKVPSAKGWVPLMQVYSMFEKAHPNVKLDQVTTSISNETAQFVAGTAPDLLGLDPSYARQYYTAGYLVSLNKYYKKYGWGKEIFKTGQDSFLVKGQYTGIPVDYEGIFVEYNADMFKQNGWKVPTNYNQLLAVSKQIQQKGIMPFAYGNSDYQGADDWWMSAILNNALGPKGMEQLWSGSMSWTNPKVESALTKFANYYQQGYVTQKKSFALSSSGQNTLFVQGRAAMMVQGTWDLSAPSANSNTLVPKFHVGYADFPNWNASGKPIFPMGTGGGWEINKHSKYPDLVAELLNDITSSNVRQAWAMYGSPYPIATNFKKLKLSAAVKQNLGMMQQSQKNGTAGYVDWSWASPGIVNYLQTQTESLYLQKVSVSNWCKKAEQVKEQDKARGLLVPLSNYGNQT